VEVEGLEEARVGLVARVEGVEGREG